MCTVCYAHNALVHRDVPEPTMKRFKEPDWDTTPLWITLPDPLDIEEVAIVYEDREDATRDAFIKDGNYYALRFVTSIKPGYGGGRGQVCLLKPVSKVKYFKKVV